MGDAGVVGVQVLVTSESTSEATSLACRSAGAYALSAETVKIDAAGASRSNALGF